MKTLIKSIGLLAALNRGASRKQVPISSEAGNAGGEIWRFNLNWLLAGTKTGKGEVPKWVGESTAMNKLMSSIIKPPIMLRFVRLTFLCLAAPVIHAAEPVTEAKHPAVTPAPRIEKWWFARHAEKIGEMSDREVNLLMIGDSITHSYDGAGSNVWKQVFEPRKAINLGFGGDFTQHALWRINHLPKLKKAPKGAIVLLGTNNVGWGSDKPEDAAKGIQAVVRRLRELYPETKILVLAVLPRRAEPTHKFRKQINELNSYLPGLLKDMKDVTLLDIGAHFLDENGFLLKGVMPDTTHPSEKGYEIWAKAMEPELKKMLGEQ